jgi:hypothetical protein
MLVEIRGKQSIIDRIMKVSVIDKNIPINVDNSIPCAVVMARDESGKLVEAFRGDDAVLQFCKYGYNRITRQCPIRHRKCIGERCSFYLIQRGTGDCAVIWSAVIKS